MYNFYDKTNRNSLAALLQCSFSKALPRPFTRLAEHSRSHRVLPRLRPPLVETTIKDSDIDLVHSSPCATLANFHLCLEDSLVPSKLAMPTLSHSTHVTTSKKTFDADVNLLMLSTRISRQSHFHSRQKYQILVQRKVDVEHKPEKKKNIACKDPAQAKLFPFLVFPFLSSFAATTAILPNYLPITQRRSPAASPPHRHLHLHLHPHFR
jgi:hypothetical protein